jgi:hypothetical protein
MAGMQGVILGKIIHTTHASTQRNQSLRAITSAIQEYGQVEKNENTVLDLSAFVLIQLRDISASVDQTAGAWEKRDYWVKADAFRRQWAWIEKPLRALTDSLPVRDAASLEKIILDLSRVLPPGKSAKRKSQSPSWSGTR